MNHFQVERYIKYIGMVTMILVSQWRQEHTSINSIPDKTR